MMRLTNFILLTIMVTMVSSSAFGQRKKKGAPPELTKKEIEKDRINHNCKLSDKYSLAERLKFYPFNTAYEIWLVSYYNLADSAFEHRLPEKNGVVDTDKLSETTLLTHDKIDSLTSLLFNVGYQGKILTSESVGCYNPRNAILFINSGGQPFEYIELCFECSGFRLSSQDIKIGEFCNQKYNMIKSFFFRQGIEIGTIME